MSSRQVESDEAMMTLLISSSLAGSNSESEGGLMVYPEVVKKDIEGVGNFEHNVAILSLKKVRNALQRLDTLLKVGSAWFFLFTK